MNRLRLVPICFVGLLSTAILIASGPVTLYGIVERMVFEPNEEHAERIQVWGAFMYVQDTATPSASTSAAKKGYLYFQIPPIGPGSIPGVANVERQRTVRNEWNDLKTVAGTSQAVGFGGWIYWSDFSALQPDRRPMSPSGIVEVTTRVSGGAPTDLRVRPATETPSNPAMYQTNFGVVKLTEANHADVIRRLKEALK